LEHVGPAPYVEGRNRLRKNVIKLRRSVIQLRSHQFNT
jgi:hypothetical protein